MADSFRNQQRTLSNPAAVPLPPPDPEAIKRQVDAYNYEQMRKDIQNHQMFQAKRFRAELPEYTGRLQGLAEEKMRNLYNSDETSIRDQMNRRGLLHSGMRQAATLGAAARRGAELAKDKTSIADQLEKTAQQFENDASQNIMDNYRDKIGQADQAYSLAMDRMKERARMMDTLWSAGGSVLGGYLGRKEG